MIDPEFSGYGHGKLLLSGEYFVLDGAASLAIPTRRGQRLTVQALEGKDHLHWTSLDDRGNTWFEGVFERTPDFSAVRHSDESTAQRITQLLNAALELSPALSELPALQVTAHLEFPRDWGLGSSSTLVYTLSRWLHIDPYALLQATFGGSGYDIACASADGPLVYQRIDGVPIVKPVQLNWPFLDQLYFVHLGKKQDSRQGIRRFRDMAGSITDSTAERISAITRLLVTAPDLLSFRSLLDEHEALVGESMNLEPVKAERFADFPGSVKSLGAWGGDLVLAAADMDEKAVRSYFGGLGYSTVLPWSDLTLERTNDG